MSGAPGLEIWGDYGSYVKIRDASGTVVASLCFIARKTLIQNVQRRDTLLEHLLHAAHLASMDLGWRPDPV